MAKKLEERNREIYEDFTNNGVRALFLAKKHNISRARVHKIIHNYHLQNVNSKA